MKLFPVIVTLLTVMAMPVKGEDLLQVYELAITNDARLRESSAKLKAIKEIKPQSLARLLPTLSIKGDMHRNSVRSSFQQAPMSIGANPLIFFAGGMNVDFWNSAASINLFQPIYHHEYWVQLSQADKQIAQAETNFAAEQQNLIKRTVESYFEALFSADSLEYFDAELVAISKQLEMAQAKYEAGLNAITDVHEAEAAYHQARTNKIRGENQLQNTLANLELITGKPPGKLSKLKETLLLNPPQPTRTEDWVEFAQQNNLSLLAATTHLDEVRQRIDQQFAGHLPTVDLVGTAGFTDNNRPYGIATEYQAIGMQVTIPVIEGGGVNSRVRQARYEYEAAQENLDGLRRSVTRDVKEAYRGVISAISQIESLEATLKSASSALEAAQTGLEVGNRTMVDVLSEQANLFRAKREYTRARYDYVVSQFKLKWASGVLTSADLLSVNQGLKAS